jgi:hypothetical protein
MFQHHISLHTQSQTKNENSSLLPHISASDDLDISIANMEYLKAKETSSDYHDHSYLSEDSASTKDSEEHHDLVPNKKSNISQKKSYKKAPQGKMDTADEELLLTLASKYKHDWKKVSKKIFKLHKKKLGPNLLRIRYKELAPDLTQKRVRFTHDEDLMIVKYYSQYGYDWEKIASQFESRTAIMVKNRFYHIKKKNILEKLLEEVDNIHTSSIQLDTTNEELLQEIPEIIQDFEEEREDLERLQFFVQNGPELYTKTLKISPIEVFFDMDGHGQGDQLYEKVTPFHCSSEFTDRREHQFEDDNIFSLTYFNGYNRRLFY